MGMFILLLMNEIGEDLKFKVEMPQSKFINRLKLKVENLFMMMIIDDLLIWNKEMIMKDLLLTIDQ